MPWHPFDRASLRSTPWKNGGGLTREIVCRPPGGGMDAFDWRVSIARIASDGPFSAFPGVDRVITLLEGEGVRLLAADGAFDHRLDRTLQPFAFPGEARVQGDLLGGACEDFNVMVRRAACRAEVRVCAAGLACDDAPSGLLLAVRGHWQAGAERLAPGQGLWWDGEPGPATLRCDDPDAALLAVHIHPVKP